MNKFLPRFCHMSNVTCQMSPRRGFTLIELLVVIVIISILAALLMVNFVGVRQRGRDAQRKSDLRQIQTALELHRSDKGAYPVTGGFPPTCNGTFMDSGTGVTYMRKVPCDPLNSTIQYQYSSIDGTTYEIFACLENLLDPDRDTGLAGSPSVKAFCNGLGGSYISITLANP